MDNLLLVETFGSQNSKRIYTGDQCHFMEAVTKNVSEHFHIFSAKSILKDTKKG